MGNQRGLFHFNREIGRPVQSIARNAHMCNPRRPSVDTVVDIDTLLWHFARPLPADRRDEFYAVAQGALSRLQCPGPGLVHRTVAGLLPSYFVPIADDCGGVRGVRAHRRPSKLVAAAPVA